MTLTYVMDESGACDYTFTIHHKRINDMSEEEREAFSAELMQACEHALPLFVQRIFLASY